MLTVKAPADEIMTSTAVPVLVDWTAQIRPNRADMDKLETCIISFKERGNQGIIDDVKLTLMGAVRDVVASMTPEQVLADKEKFKQLIQESVTDELDNMGLELVSLNIQDITDNNGYFKSIAYLDHAEKEKAEEIKRADTDRITREKKAEAALAAEKAEAESKKQANLAAQKEREVMITKAEAQKQTAKINAQATADVKSIEAENEIAVAERRADALRKEATGMADVEKTKAEARAANDKVNFEIEKLKISTETQIKVATAEIMANIGQNAEFVNIGGGNIHGIGGAGTGNALFDTLSSIPALMKILNAENQALNGQNMTDEIAGLSNAALSGLGNLKGTIAEKADNMPLQLKTSNIHMDKTLKL